MLVLDASAVVDLLLDMGPGSDRVAALMRQHEGDLHAPHLIDAEVGQVIRRHVLHLEYERARAQVALARLKALPLTRYPHVALIDRAFELIDNATVYDALYLALAELLGAPLATRDRSLASVPGHSAEVIVI